MRGGESLPGVLSDPPRPARRHRRRAVSPRSCGRLSGSGGAPIPFGFATGPGSRNRSKIFFGSLESKLIFKLISCAPNRSYLPGRGDPQFAGADGSSIARSPSRSGGWSSSEIERVDEAIMAGGCRRRSMGRGIAVRGPPRRGDAISSVHPEGVAARRPEELNRIRRGGEIRDPRTRLEKPFRRPSGPGPSTRADRRPRFVRDDHGASAGIPSI